MVRNLNVRYTEWPPWAMTVHLGNKTTLDGVMKDVLGALSHSLNYKFSIEDQENHMFGSLQADGSYSGMLGVLDRKEADIGGPFGASEERASVVDFTNCLDFYKLGIITGIQSTDRNMFLYFNVFSWQVWLLLFVAVVFCALISILIYDVSVNGWKANQSLLLSRYCWVFWSTLIGHDVGTTDHWALRDIWYKHSFRVLLAAWLLGPVFISLYTFQGTITSTFAITKLKPVISGFDDLKEKKKVIPVITRGSAVEICFKTSKDHAYLWERMQNNSIKFSAKTVEVTMRKVEKGTHVLIVDYIYALSIVSNWVKRTGRCTIQVEELLFCQNFMALGLRKGFDKEKKKKINSQLTYIMQAKLADRWLNRVHSNYTHCTRQPSESSKPLSITDIMGGFVLWAIGITTAVILLIAEIITFQTQKQKGDRKYTTNASFTDPSLGSAEVLTQD